MGWKVHGSENGSRLQIDRRRRQITARVRCCHSNGASAMRRRHHPQALRSARGLKRSASTPRLWVPSRATDLRTPAPTLPEGMRQRLRCTLSMTVNRTRTPRYTGTLPPQVRGPMCRQPKLVIRSHRIPAPTANPRRVTAANRTLLRPMSADPPSQTRIMLEVSRDRCKIALARRLRLRKAGFPTILSSIPIWSSCIRISGS